MITNDERIRPDVRSNKIACGRSPHVHEELGGRHRLRREAQWRQGHGDVSKAAQGQDGLHEPPASSGAKTVAVPSLIYGCDVDGQAACTTQRCAARRA